MLERSRAALDHAKRARDELAAWCSEKLDTAAVRTTTGVSIGMDPESTKRRDDFLYRFRSAVGLLMAVGPTIDDELGPAGQKGWWEPMLQPHSKNLMKLRDLTLKHTNPPASVKHDLQGQLLEVSGAGGAAGGRTVANVRIVASKWTWDAGPYAGDNVLTVFDLYMDLLEKKVLPEAERLISRTAPPP
jgi:hypothetical protein